MNFADRVTPAVVREGFAKAASSKPELCIMHALTGERIWEWLHSVGVVHHEDLAGLLPAVPPIELRRITNSPDAVQFLWSGLLEAEKMITLYERHGRAASPATVLDFGCGCGRLCRYLSMRPDLWEVHSCEVNPDHVAWLQVHLAIAHPLRSPLEPQLPYRNGQFDLIYALSVFSHLPPRRAVPWMVELRRVMRPGGILVVTTHGRAALDKAARSPEHLRLLALNIRSLEWAQRELLEKGVFYSAYSSDIISAARAGADYGSVVIGREKFREWAGGVGLEIIEYTDADLSGWQDVIVMRAKDSIESAAVPASELV